MSSSHRSPLRPTEINISSSHRSPLKPTRDSNNDNNNNTNKNNFSKWKILRVMRLAVRLQRVVHPGVAALQLHTHAALGHEPGMSAF